MLEKKIVELREKLNKSIANDEKYEIIYSLSIELDELIARYYLKNKIKCIKKEKTCKL